VTGGREARLLVLVDRDGVINVDSADYIKSAAEWRPLPGSLEAIAELTAADRAVVVVSNQAGVGRGLFTSAALREIDAAMTAAIEGAGGKLSGIFYCLHRPEDGCDCRKPKPGLLTRVERELGLSVERAPFIGDKASDIEAAHAANARPVLVRTGYGNATERLPAARGVPTFDDLKAAAEAIINGRL
jgi:D-glycero-D-manno-heptose 1,7-bisphosphate phosphatase